MSIPSAQNLGASAQKNSIHLKQVTLTGLVVHVVPLDPLTHGNALYEGTHGDDRELLWRYLPWGPYRDTAWYSMLDSEWPVRKEAVERWLDASNFNKAGQQRVPLHSLTDCS